jgi:hypothetical protein
VGPRHHVERILGREAAGDFRVARWEPVRLRYGRDMAARHYDWRGKAAWQQSAENAAYYRQHPVA